MNCPKKKFTPQEDALLIKLVEKYGACKWDTIALSMNGRKGRQCRDRYMNYLNPNVKRDEWTLEEDMLLTEKVKEHGPKWAKISKFFEGRTGPALKNRWNYKLSRLENKRPKLKNTSSSSTDEEDSKPLASQNDNNDLIISNFTSHGKRRAKQIRSLDDNEPLKKQEKSSNIMPLLKSSDYMVKNQQSKVIFTNNINGQANSVNDTLIEAIFGGISREEEIGLIYDCYDYLLGRDNMNFFFEV